MNAPMRFLSWRWEDEEDEERLTYQPDTKRANCGTFIMQKEDHTLGNLLRLQLLRDPSVRYAGYRMPHPLIFDTHLKIETMDRNVTPKQALKQALKDLQQETESLEIQFKDAIDDFERNSAY